MAGGLAVRVPDPEALEIIRRGAARIVTVSEAEMRRAMRIMFSDTHNVAEGAGAAALAAALQERGRLAGKRVAAIQSGGNIDRPLFAEVLAEETRCRASETASASSRRWPATVAVTAAMKAPTIMEKAVKNEAGRRRLARLVGGLVRLEVGVLGLRDDVVDPLVGIGLADPGPRGDELGQIAFVRCRTSPSADPKR